MFTMSEDNNISNVQKFIALSVVTGLMIVGGFLLYAVSGGNNASSVNSTLLSCETNYNPQPCPEPDYDSQSIEDSKKYSDDMPGDAPDACGSYDCDTLRQEFEQYEQ